MTTIYEEAHHHRDLNCYLCSSFEFLVITSLATKQVIEYDPTMVTVVDEALADTFLRLVSQGYQLFSLALSEHSIFYLSVEIHQHRFDSYSLKKRVPQSSLI